MKCPDCNKEPETTAKNYCPECNLSFGLMVDDEPINLIRLGAE